LVARRSSRREPLTPQVSSGRYGIKKCCDRLADAVTKQKNAVTRSPFSRGVVRPREIPRDIWERIRCIAYELHLTIPDTLDLLADLYQDVRAGSLLMLSGV